MKGTRDLLFVCSFYVLHNYFVGFVLITSPSYLFIYLFLSFCFYSFLLRRWSAWWRHAPFCRQTDAVTLNRHAGWGQGPGKKMLRADGEIRDAFCNMQETKGIRTELLVAWFTNISWKCHRTGVQVQIEFWTHVFSGGQHHWVYKMAFLTFNEFIVELMPQSPVTRPWRRIRGMIMEVKTHVFTELCDWVISIPVSHYGGFGFYCRLRNLLPCQWFSWFSSDYICKCYNVTLE